MNYAEIERRTEPTELLISPAVSTLAGRAAIELVSAPKATVAERFIDGLQFGTQQTPECITNRSGFRSQLREFLHSDAETHIRGVKQLYPNNRLPLLIPAEQVKLKIPNFQIVYNEMLLEEPFNIPLRRQIDEYRVTALNAKRCFIEVSGAEKLINYFEGNNFQVASQVANELIVTYGGCINELPYQW